MARTVNVKQHEARRQSILAAAGRLFAVQGFAGTTIAEISEAAGVSTGNLFHYFPSKQAVFRAIFEQDIPVVRALFAKHQDAPDPLEALLTIISDLSAPQRTDLTGGVILELVRRVERDATLAASIETTEAIMQTGFLSLLKKAMARGQIDPKLDPADAATWLRMIVDTVHLYRMGSEADPRPVLRILITRFLVANNLEDAA